MILLGLGVVLFGVLALWMRPHALWEVTFRGLSQQGSASRTRLKEDGR